MHGTMANVSTLVIYGQGRSVVAATVDGTEVGRISQLIAEAQELETPLTRKIAQFSRLALCAVLPLASVTLATGVLRGNPAAHNVAGFSCCLESPQCNLMGSHREISPSRRKRKC